MIFQHFNVFPHLTVLENITITPILELKTPKAEAEKEAIELLKKVGLEDKKDEYPKKIIWWTKTASSYCSCFSNASGCDSIALNQQKCIRSRNGKVY